MLTRTFPIVSQQEICFAFDVVQTTLVQVERFDNTALRIMDGLVNFPRGRLDEARRNFDGHPFKLKMFVERLKVLLLLMPAIVDVDDRCEPSCGLHEIEIYVDRSLRAVHETPQDLAVCVVGKRFRNDREVRPVF